jgi:hypothetical protein
MQGPSWLAFEMPELETCRHAIWEDVDDQCTAQDIRIFVDSDVFLRR